MSAQLSRLHFKCPGELLGKKLKISCSLSDFDFRKIFGYMKRGDVQSELAKIVRKKRSTEEMIFLVIFTIEKKQGRALFLT